MNFDKDLDDNEEGTKFRTKTTNEMILQWLSWGKKTRHTFWRDGLYIQLKNNTIVDENGDEASVSFDDSEDWFIV